MDFDKVRDLDDAGIDAFEFSLMDEYERREALRDAGLNEDNYDDIEYDLEFDAWQNLQDAGLSFSEIEAMDDEERAEVLREHDLNPDDYEDLMPPIIPVTTQVRKSEEKSYRYCTVTFSLGSGSYSYLVGDVEVGVGDDVIVPVGPDNKPTTAKVVSVGDYAESAAPYPPAKTKHVLRKASAADIERPQLASVQSKEQEEPAQMLEAPTERLCTEQLEELEQKDTSKAPVQEDSDENQTARTRGKWGTPHWLGVAVALFFVTLISMSLADGGKPLLKPDSTAIEPAASKTSSQTTSSGTSTYRSSYSSTPPCPPVNREKAMTREEAERLSGTGYHNTRPNSSAENLELAAAQTKCKNCGYRTHNGANSLCDYCRWMERYGGGLATSSNTSASSATTTKPSYTRPATSSSSTKKDDDPYHAKSYSNPEDFYYDYYDDFWEFEEAEDYWNEHRRNGSGFNSDEGRNSIAELKGGEIVLK